MTLTNKILELLQDPDNRKIVNEGQHYFKVTYHAEYQLLHIDFIFVSPTYFDILKECLKFVCIIHCIKLLPYFQHTIKNDYIIIKYQDINKLSEHGYSSELTTMPNYFKLEVTCAPDQTDKSMNIAHYIKDTKTFSEALLQSGAMTVEELEKEYKKLTI